MTAPGVVLQQESLFWIRVAMSLLVNDLLNFSGMGVLLGWQYYNYRLETPFARTGTHNLATATAKGNVVLLFVVSANDAQWASSQRLLKTILESFTA